MLPCRELRRAPFIYLGRLFLSRGAFLLEQALLAVRSPAIASRRAVESYDTVARHHHRDPVVGASVPDGAHCLGRSDRIGDLAVRACLAERNLLQLAPNLPLKGRGLDIDRNLG